ncbi:Gfo/Idh/MocA family oxidoreductase [Paenibacillus sp. CC-CFT747]|nr:Gfo/Idh/MocA family oxidoreductase [Paenibacillus sp. CC-CFT747]
MFAKPLTEEFQVKARLVGVCDVNPIRAERLSEDCGKVPVYTEFDRMLTESGAEIIIVAVPDHLHHVYVVSALEAGCDVITEKPMTIDAEKCQAILEAERRTGRSVKVTFNCRFMPHMARIKQLLKDGAIGTIRSIHMEWSLDGVHGADYFRRWHRRMENSGGLLVHKSTHHFDLINWWLEDEPEELYAYGLRNVFGEGRRPHGERCLTCTHTTSCEFNYDITKDEFAKRYYLEAEEEDGYFRDACVFAEEIDILDTFSVNVKYSGGALLTYSLSTNSPYEGWKVAIQGTKGKLEAEEYYSGPHAAEPPPAIKLYNRRNERILYESPRSPGAHGGGDSRLRAMLFEGGSSDPLGQLAGAWAGAMSLLIGAAANRSIREGKPIAVKELLEGKG